MTDKVFVNSNILIYAHDYDSGIRQQRAADCLKQLWDSRAGRLNTQVIQEFYVNVTQKIRSPLDKSTAQEVIRNYHPGWNHRLLPGHVFELRKLVSVATLVLGQYDIGCCRARPSHSSVDRKFESRSRHSPDENRKHSLLYKPVFRALR